MKVFILTEGGKGIGFGHITRCSAIYDAFRVKGLAPLLVINADNDVEDILGRRKFRILNWLKDQDKLFNIIAGADIVIVDSYLANRDLYLKISRRIKVAAYIDDNNRLHYPTGIVINGSIYADRLRYPKSEGVTYLLGAKYMPLRKEFWKVRNKKINKNVREALVTFGGDDSKGMTPKILKFLSDKYPKWKKTFIVGMSFNNAKKIEKMCDEKTELVYCPDTKKVKRLMLRSDVAISAGGQTLYELARVGLPAIAIAVAKNQLNNIKEWEKVGFIDYAGWYNEDKLAVKLYAYLDRLADYRIRAKRSILARSYIDGKGADRIADRILGIAKYRNSSMDRGAIRLRRAVERDCLAILSWRNHPEVRKQSFVKERIGRLKHEKWFLEKLKDKNASIYIAEMEGLGKIGHIRFDILKDRSARVNVNLNPLFFGMGLGNKIITKGMGYFLKENPDIKLITAEILDENICSKKAFQKANYVFSYESSKNNKNSVLYKFEN